jgi:hypothetical protein
MPLKYLLESHITLRQKVGRNLVLEWKLAGSVFLGGVVGTDMIIDLWKT